MTAPLQGVLMTKVPQAGHVKTRLAPLLGPAGAAAVHGLLLERTLELVAASGVRLAAAVAGDLGSPAGRQLRDRLGRAGMTLLPQRGADLGARLRAAMTDVAPEPGQPVLAIGGDCPLFEPAWLRAAADADEPVALGPANDGGYWVVALRGPDRDPLMDLLFTDMQWSTPQVFATSARRVAAAGHRLGALPRCADVDTPDDLRTLLDDPRCPPQLAARIRALLPSP